MSIKRKHVFVNENYYHVYNRGIDRRNTFTNKREYQRMLELFSFYKFRTIPIRYSRFNEAKEDLRQRYYEQMEQSGKLVEIVSFCLMPNHFHLLLKQCVDKGFLNMFLTSSMPTLSTLILNTKEQVRFFREFLKQFM